METIRLMLSSRKVLTAIATIVAAVLASKGLNVSEDAVLGILGVGATVILGTAWEDAAKKGA